MEAGYLVPIAFFAMIAAIVILPKYFKSKERESVQQIVRAAIEKGQALPPETVDAITRDFKAVASPMRDFRAGVVWLAVAAGFAILGYTISWEEGDAFPVMLGIAAIPGLVGLVYLAMGAINASSQKKR